MKHPNELSDFKAELDATAHREQRLIERETQLSIDLNSERVKLTELNDKLTALELEMVPK